MRRSLAPAATAARVVAGALLAGCGSLDRTDGLLGAITTPAQIQDPARRALDQKVSDLQNQGYVLQGTRTTTTGYVSTMSKGAARVTVTVDRSANRTLSVQVTETTMYRY